MTTKSHTPECSLCGSRGADRAPGRIPWQRRFVRLAALIFGAALVASVRADDNPFPFTFTRVAGEYRLTLGAYQYYYFGFQHTEGLTQPYSTIGMALGTPGPVFGYTPFVGETQAFLRAEAIDVWSPRDSDGDGIDDLWELQNALDPLHPADALLPNAADPNKTNLQYYRDRFGLVRVAEFYSHETSVFNHAFSISTEVSVFNSGVNGFSVEVLSQETSVFNFGPPEPSVQALSLETSVFNFGPPAPSVQAVSQEISVFNYGPLGPAIEAISLEVSVLKN